MSRHRLRRGAPVLAVLAAACALPAPAHAATGSLPELRTGPPPAAQERDRGAGRGRAVLAAARSRVGSAYAMGASGPSAFDCSGLTTYAHARAGVSLPRTSFAQFALGEPVARDELRAGDLVFFSTAGPGASHVGVATGRGTAISATSSGGVREHAIGDAYWAGAYVGARRLTS